MLQSDGSDHLMKCAAMMWRISVSSTEPLVVWLCDCDQKGGKPGGIISTPLSVTALGIKPIQLPVPL